MRDPTGRADCRAYESLPFQSTGPVRDPTPLLVEVIKEIFISIHGSREGPDEGRSRYGNANDEFQSTGPVRDPTKGGCNGNADDAFQSTGPVRDPTLV